jgi:hypothetical protein
MSKQESVPVEDYLPSVMAPLFLFFWFLLWGLMAVFAETGHGELDLGEAVFGGLFFITYPIFLTWLLVGSFRHLKNYRFNPLAPASSHFRVYIWCCTAALYFLGLAAFVALEGYGLKRYF